MDVQPDCDNPSTGSAAGEPLQYGELPLNGPSSATDVGDPPDPRIGPEVDSLSIFVSEQASPGRRDSVPPAVLTQAQPPRAGVASPAKRPDDRGRSWLWRLRSSKASWETTHLQRGAHAEPVTTEAISHLEKHLAALAMLPDLCARIDQRLARVEAVSGPIDDDTIDEALDDLRTQIDDRLVRVEVALQRTDVADKTLRELCENIDARLVRTEDTLRRPEGIVAGWLQLEKHLAALATLPDFCARIDQRLARVETVSGPIDGDAIDEALDDLRTQIDDRLVRVEAALQRTQEAVADKTLCELYESIDTRLVRTEDTLRRTEGIVAGWLQRVAEAEETIQRVERVVSSGATEQTPSQRRAVRIDGRPVQTAQQLERLLGDVPADVDLRSRSYATTESGKRADRGVLRRFVNTKQTIRAVRLPWMVRVPVPVMVIVTAVAVGALIRTSRGATPETGVSLASINQMSISAAPATTPGDATLSAESVAGQPRAPSTTALRANASPSTGGGRVSASEQRSGDRESAIASTPRTFVGTLSITSIPPGASVLINGKAAGVTPFKVPRQRAGSLAVQITQDGFERWSAAVHVPADRLTEVTAKLRPIDPSLPSDWQQIGVPAPVHTGPIPRSSSQNFKPKALDQP